MNNDKPLETGEAEALPYAGAPTWETDPVAKAIDVITTAQAKRAAAPYQPQGNMAAAQAAAPIAAIDLYPLHRYDLNGDGPCFAPNDGSYVLYDDLVALLAAPLHPLPAEQGAAPTDTEIKAVVDTFDIQRDDLSGMYLLSPVKLCAIVRAVKAAPQQQAQADRHWVMTTPESGQKVVIWDALEAARFAAMDGRAVFEFAPVVQQQAQASAPSFNQDEFDKMVGKGTAAWEGVEFSRDAQAALSNEQIKELAQTHAAWKSQDISFGVHFYEESLLRFVAAILATRQHAPLALTPMGSAGNEWYFDCAGHYIDVKRDDAGKYSVYFRNRKDSSEAWHDQADIAPVAAAAQGEAAIPASREVELFPEYTSTDMDISRQKGRAAGLEEAEQAVRAVLYDRENAGLNEQACGAQDSLAAIRALNK